MQKFMTGFAAHEKLAKNCLSKKLYVLVKKETCKR